MGASEVSRLRWQCRRGMLELDYLLLGYLEHQFDNTSNMEQELFVSFLSEADEDIGRWLLSGDENIPSKYIELVSKVRKLSF